MKIITIVLIFLNNLYARGYTSGDSLLVIPLFIIIIIALVFLFSSINKIKNNHINTKLNNLYPNAKNKEIITYSNNKYIKKFMPLEKKGSKVISWESYWVKLLEK
jgi:hypothetical protein